MFRWLLLVSACATTVSGTVRPLVVDGYKKLDAKNFVGAEQDFKAAQRALIDDPDERGALAVVDGLARADVGLIAAAVKTQVELAGHDLEAIAELHALHLRLREIGGNAEVETELVRGVNIHASQLMAPHEQATGLTDVREVLAIGKYPELTDDTRKRLQALSMRAWRVFDGRARATPSPLVKRVFEGLAAHYSGDALPDARALRDAELASYTRGTAIVATIEPGCAGMAFDELAHKGKYEVDASVAVTKCTSKSWSTEEMVVEDFVDRIPYQDTVTEPHQVCSTVKVPVMFCSNPYTHDHCVMSGSKRR